MADIAATAAGQQATVTVTPNVAQTYRSAAIELVASPVNHTADASEAMHTVLMNANRDKNYVLPATGLSPTWCNWFMPTGSNLNTYELEPEATRQINGQNQPIRIPSWQMTRICQDNQGSFWASPPLLAGTGISITGSNTGVTISTSGGGMAYIAGGTAHLPGSVSVPAGSCVDWHVQSASGVLPTDVVSWSLQSGTATSGWAYIVTRAYPNTDQITWRNCNSATTAYAPAARDANWYVLRHTVSAVATRHRVVHHQARKKP